jgi:hypothetical protein
MLHGQHPWYRASRDNGNAEPSAAQERIVSTSEGTKTQIPGRGNFFFGYSHTGASHCEVTYSGAATTCDPLSNVSANLSGWDVSVEKMYLRYFGAIVDFSGQYGSASQRDFLFGVRGGASVVRLRPFAHFMIGAVQARENAAQGSLSDNSFAEDLGVGVDFQVARLFAWRNQIDALKTGSPTFERRNVRVSSGLAVRF